MNPHSGIARIVVTGGPCSGKTTLLKRLRTPVSEVAARFYPVSEVASILILAGARTRATKDADMLRFQKHVMKVQMVVEDAIVATADAGLKPGVIVFDRGIFDGGGFLDSVKWRSLLNELHLDPKKEMERYDYVLHLETVAKNYPEYYSDSNNSARLETPEEACLVEKRIRKAWSDHGNITVVESRINFEEKMSDAIDSVLSFLSLTFKR